MKPVSFSVSIGLAAVMILIPAGRARAQAVCFFSETLNSDPGWTTESDWAFGNPAGLGGCAPHPTPSPGLCTESWGYPDPTSGYTGDNVYGYNLNGDYPLNMHQTYYLTTPSINCSGYRSVSLKFWRWLNVERRPYDFANIQVSSDGINWQIIWQNPEGLGEHITDFEWLHCQYNIASVADDQASVRIRWGLGPTDNDYTSSGWNIDDIELWGIPPTPTPPPTATPTISPVPSATPSPSLTPTPTPYGYQSPTPSITPTPTTTPTTSPVPTASPSPTPSPTPTAPPTSTPTPTTTPTPSATPTRIPTATPISTPTPGVPVPIYLFHLDSDPGWTTESAWAFGPPDGGCDIPPFYPNPTEAHTGEYIYGFNLSGCYGASMPPYSLTTTAIDCSELVKTYLVFYRWMNIERWERDKAAIAASHDGWNWQTIWENPPGDWVRDSTWQRQEYNISSIADHQTSVYVRWVMGPTDGDVELSGWNIDDIEIWAVPPGPSPSPTAFLTPSPTPLGYKTPSPTATPIATATPAPSPSPTPTAIPTTTPLAAPWIHDFNGDGISDIGVFRPSSGLWAIRLVTRAYWGRSGDEPVPGDYDGDGTTDIAAYRPTTGYWFIKDVTRVFWGKPGDIPVPFLYSNPSAALQVQIGIYRPSSGLWAIRGVTRAYWGQAGGNDDPLPGDYSGDGTTNIGCYRPSTGYWFIKGLTRIYWGKPNDDLPAPGDYGMDRKWIPAIFRQSSGMWAARGVSRAYWGRNGDIPVPGDYGGYGRDQIGAYRPSTGYWFIKDVTKVFWGKSGDVPVSR